ncbi:Glutathione S-transferase, N-terminal domain containing protein [Novymonas esmeraldas]|uniref:Glutathione S-transferase, N-terminal domain containing protein n=1 Tax=Novymonas esmeraldas TaxID=1808958 RepID=A0AAW0FAJ9_9TRYP
MVVSLIGPLESPFVQRTLLVAAYAGIQLKLVPIRVGTENETEEYRINCHPMQRVPVMKTDEGYLFESNAMIRYLARTEVMLVAVGAGQDGGNGGAANNKIPHPQYAVPYAMYGHSLLESTQVDSWLDFAVTHIDLYALPFAAHERGTGPRPDADAQTLLRKGLAGLERRLTYLRDTRRALLRQSGALTARSAMTEEELLWNEEDYMASRATRDSRLSSVYNVAGSIRHRWTEKDRQEREKQLDSIKKATDAALGEEDGAGDAHRASRRMSSSRDSMMISATPRASVLMSARGSVAGGGVGGSDGQRQDLVFLVGDSLTAADLVVATAVHGALCCRELKPMVITDYPQVFRYYKSILTLPVAVEVGKAIRLSVIKA